MMRKLDEAIISAWRDASHDLGIRVIAPFDISTDSGETVRYEVFIADFGASKGTVAGVLSDPFPDTLRINQVFYAPNLGPSYQRYDRDLFLATLNDWKWFGDGTVKPLWYTGENWS